ncbi:glycosyl hydrolase [Paenibacillus swuensis]|uniref:glycosyl hydrolase n=1 Tax=Paenibacillus swuensis TaxID=1178515 RepID=UPI000837D27F|nr:glycosyl hydrolase [Paenibacillus swuensis]
MLVKDSFRRVLAIGLSLCFIMYAFTGLSGRANAAQPPVNSDATQASRDLLQYLYNTSGNHILSGQFNYIEDPSGWSNQVQNITGKRPALWGSDFAWEEIKHQRQGMVNAAIAEHQAGSIVTLSWHQQKPNDPDNAGWGSVQGWYTEQEMTELVTPGTTLYNQWLAKADEIAGYLQQLEDAGVPVLWRPYHENNAGWFWWGGRQAQFKQLWMNMYDRYTNHHGLDNLIWVWSANANNDWAEPLAGFYPGHDYVDVVGQDIYDGFQQAYYDELLAVGNGKPMAITENGKVPGSATFSSQPLYAFHMVWGSHLTSENTNGEIQSSYNDPYVFTRDEVNIVPGSGGTGGGGDIVVDDAVTGTGNNQFNYVGTWQTSSDASHHNGGDHYSATTNSYYDVDFQGTQVKVYGTKDAHHGIAAVSIDGGAETMVDLYSASRNPNTILWTSPVLSAGNHTVKVRVTGTKNASSAWNVVTADRIVVTPASTVLNDATVGTGLNQFEYSGTWSTSTGGGKYQGNDHYSATTGSFYQVDFNGKQVKIYGTKDAHHGIAGVSIDGGAEVQADFYGASRVDNTLVWTSPVLSSGNHTVKVRVTGTKNASSTWNVITADRVEVVH